MERGGDVPINPRLLQMVSGQLLYRVDPLPESEVTFTRLEVVFVELRSTHHVR